VTKGVIPSGGGGEATSRHYSTQSHKLSITSRGKQTRERTYHTTQAGKNEDNAKIRPIARPQHGHGLLQEHNIVIQLLAK
jgi:hypothetical protein